MKKAITPTGREVYFAENDIIVSKTDLKGKITYANTTFMDISGYRKNEVIGAPHNMIRHPDMPRCVFKLLWETISSKAEIFAYVKNMTKSGDHYWVLAHVTPSLNADNEIVGYHSNRRVPNRDVLTRTIEPLYAKLRQEELSQDSKKKGLELSQDTLTALIADKGVSYDEFVFSL
ncbi:PAS domain-containing protein [Coralliovum pocilloporae]|uniref:PAS domain-containing protein n=1 Tax=Coralliovum pocilloporae TaxID=3066369 RepID=UPI003306D42C